MKHTFLVLAFSVLTLEAHAQWLCREASSKRIGQTITACGVGYSQNLDEARVKSRESAIEEFKRVCQLSEDCSNFDYIVVPKRTDCEFKKGDHICYRALDFEISDHKRKSVSLDLSDLEVELKQKSQEIQSIQDRIEKIEQVKKSETEMANKKQELVELEMSLNKKEAEALKLEDLKSKETVESGGYKYLHQIYKSSIKVSFYYWDAKLTSSKENDLMWIAEYERRPYSWLGLQLYGGFGRGHLDNQKNSDSDVPTMGTPSSTENYNGTVAYADLGVAAVLYSGWRGTYLKVELGYISGRKEDYVISYNGAGVGNPKKGTSNFYSRYIGGLVGFDTRDDQKGWGVFFEAGARKINDQSSPGFIVGVGVNYGF